MGSIPSSRSITTARTNRAALLIGGGTVLWIGMPVVVALSPLSPLLFAALWQLTSAAFLLGVLGVWYRDLMFDVRVRGAVLRGMRTRLFAGIVCTETDLILFLWASDRATPAVAAVLFEVWPLVLIAMGTWLFRAEQRYLKLQWSVVPGVAAVLCGAAAVVLSYEPLDASLQGAVLAVLFGAGAATVFAAKLAWTVRLGAQVAADLREMVGADSERVEIVAVLLLAAASGLPLVVLAVVKHDELMSTAPTVLLLVAVAGVAINGGSRVGLRIGNVLTRNLDVNFLSALAPAGSVALLLWLGLAGEVDGTRLVFGTVLVAAGNGWLRVAELQQRR